MEPSPGVVFLYNKSTHNSHETDKSRDKVVLRYGPNFLSLLDSQEYKARQLMKTIDEADEKKLVERLKKYDAERAVYLQEKGGKKKPSQSFSAGGKIGFIYIFLDLI